MFAGYLGIPNILFLFCFRIHKFYFFCCQILPKVNSRFQSLGGKYDLEAKEVILDNFEVEEDGILEETAAVEAAEETFPNVEESDEVAKEADQMETEELEEFEKQEESLEGRINLVKKTIFSTQIRIQRKY